MKNSFVFIFFLIGLVTLGQENNLDLINNEVRLIELDSTLKEKEFDWNELNEITTDGGGTLRVWRKRKQVCKIVEEVGLSYGRIRIVIYLKNEKPIKILEIEENFELKDNEFNYEKLDEVYREEVYVFDWENDISKIKRTGKRNMSEASYSLYELVESVIKRAKKAMK